MLNLRNAEYIAVVTLHGSGFVRLGCHNRRSPVTKCGISGCMNSRDFPLMTVTITNIIVFCSKPKG